MEPVLSHEADREVNVFTGGLFTDTDIITVADYRECLESLMIRG